MLKKNEGFTIIEALIAIAITAVTTLVIVSYITHTREQLKLEMYLNLQTDFSSQIDDFFSSPSSCSALLNDPTLGSSPLVVNHDNDVTYQFSRQVPSSIFTSQVTFNVDTDTLLDASSTDADNQSFVGVATINIQFANKELGNKYNGIINSKIVLPIRIYGDTKASNLKDLKCSSIRTESALYIGQICNLYGGLYSDGVHCDFPSIQTVDTNGVVLKSTTKMDANSAVVTRISMPEMICYLDTLKTLANSLPQAVPDVSSTRTLFCSSPGDVNHISQDLPMSRYPAFPPH